MWKYEVRIEREYCSWSEDYQYVVTLFSKVFDNAVTLKEFQYMDSEARRYATEVYKMFEPADCRYVDNSYA